MSCGSIDAETTNGFEMSQAEGVPRIPANLAVSATFEHALLAALLDNMSQGVCVVDGTRRLVMCNHSFVDIYGLGEDDVKPGAEFRTAALDSVDARVIELPGGRMISVRQQAMPGGGWLTTHDDITHRLTTEGRLAYLAGHDSVTGLPNRAALSDHLQLVLAHVSADDPCAVLLISLGPLWLVDTTISRDERDHLLRLAGKLLRQALRPADLVGHIGSAEFAIVLAGAVDAARTSRLAGQLLKLVSAPIELGGRTIVVEASIGVTTAAMPGLDAEAMLTQASIALHRAQTEGRGRFRLFEPEMDALLQERNALEADLRDAVHGMRFQLHYQPQFGLPRSDTAHDSLQLRCIEGFEALLRWSHPVRGTVSPALFIPIAEELGLIDEIGRWVLDRACADCASWPGELPVSVNVSGRQFEDADLPTVVQSALARHGLAPARLELEVTETCVISDPARAARTMRELHAIGVRMAMDDFGTGYSSLSYLPELPFDRIKIDRSFVARLDGSPTHVAIVRAIVGLCRSLGVGCIAEGVETEEQLAALSHEGCRSVQGYLLGRPVPTHGVADLLARQGGRTATPKGTDIATLDDISFRTIIEATNDVIIVTDASLDTPGPRILFVNSAFERLTGYTLAETIGATPRMLQGPGTSRVTLGEIRQELAAGREVHRKVLNYAKSGTPYWLDLRIAPLRDAAGRIVQFVAIERDVTLDKRRLDELEQVADRDALTGIANRRAMLRRLEAELAAVQPGDCGPCLAYVDVDHFKRINDEHGHSVGDMVLFGVADRLAENMRPLDFAGRIGSEEFAVCMPSSTMQEAMSVAARLRRAIAAEPFDTPIGPLRATVSVGVAAAQGGKAELSGLLARADQAMYAAKRAGRNRVVAENVLFEDARVSSSRVR